MLILIGATYPAQTSIPVGRFGATIAAVADIPGSKFYAVNDRPVAVVPTAQGGADCVVFDFATGEMVPDRSYFGYVTPGSGRDVDVLTEAEFEARLATSRSRAGALATGRLREWAEQLCAATGTAADVAAALGFPGAAPAADEVTVDPPPPGYHEMKVSSSRGRRASATLRSAGRLLTREALEAGLGPGREMPIFPDSGDEGNVVYRVVFPGVPGQCDIRARFRRGAAAYLSLTAAD
jgi:hypothetical protein